MNTKRQYLRPLGGLALCLAIALVAGCGTYQMRGVVVEGSISRIRVVSEDDPRLKEGYALPLALVECTLDADRLSRKELPQGMTDVDGTFAVPVDETGAGYLDYYVRVVVRKSGYDTAVQNLRVPGPKQRLLVTLAHGVDQYKPKPKDMMDETLELSEPYMH